MPIIDLEKKKSENKFSTNSCYIYSFLASVNSPSPLALQLADSVLYCSDVLEEELQDMISGSGWQTKK